MALLPAPLNATAAPSTSKLNLGFIFSDDHSRQGIGAYRKWLSVSAAGEET